MKPAKPNNPSVKGTIDKYDPPHAYIFPIINILNRQSCSIAAPLLYSIDIDAVGFRCTQPNLRRKYDLNFSNYALLVRSRSLYFKLELQNCHMKYRRAKVAGGTYFFTVVTHNRRPFLCEPENIELLRDAFRYIKNSHPLTIDAIAILPEHIHCLWTLPPTDNDFSTRWRLLKSYFTRHCQEQYKGEISASRFDKREQAIWQRRFWEHQIQDERDFIYHFDYIHYNPVKHKLVRSPKDWQFSSFHHHVGQGIYTLDWGS